MGRNNPGMQVEYALQEIQDMKDKNHNSANDAEKHVAAEAEHGHAEEAHAKDHKPHNHGHVHPQSDHKHESGKAPAEPAPTDDELKAAQAQAATLNDRLIRLQADFDNMRKRVVKERADIYVRANEDIMLEILPVLDHFDMALATAAEHDTSGAHAAVVDGFRLAAEQLVSVLKKFGLESINAEGQQFDTSRHEAIAQMPSKTVAEGMVLTQTRRGWMLGDRLLRPAQVVLSSGPESDVAAENREEPASSCD
jgi:molecular chaperone GrpE